MRFDWQNDEGQPDALSTKAGDASDHEPKARRHYRLVILGFLVLLTVVGWRVLADRMLAQLQRDVSAVVKFEEHARQDGDLELYRSIQSDRRAKELKSSVIARQRFFEQPAPLPGLALDMDSSHVSLVDPVFDNAFGGRVERSVAQVQYAISDSLGSAVFAESRWYQLDPARGWLRVDSADPLLTEPLRWMGRHLDVYYLQGDAALLLPILEHADMLLDEFCADSDLCSRSELRFESGSNPEQAGPTVSPVRLMLTSDWSDVGHTVYREDIPYLMLAAPSLSMSPIDETGADVLVRFVTRLAIAQMVDMSSNATYTDGRGHAVAALQDNAFLLWELIDAWLAVATGADLEPSSPPPALTARSYSQLQPLGGHWYRRGRDTPSTEGPGFQSGLTPEGRWLLRDFARYVSENLSTRSLARLISSLPDAPDFGAWIATNVDESERLALLTWAPVKLRFPANRALVLECQSTSRSGLLLTLNRGNALRLDIAACGGERSVQSAWRPNGELLAVRCSRYSESPDPGRDTLHLLDPGRASVPSLLDSQTLSFDSSSYSYPMQWSADGNWLAWTSALSMTRESTAGWERELWVTRVSESGHFTGSTKHLLGTRWERNDYWNPDGSGAADSWYLERSAPLTLSPTTPFAAAEVSTGQVVVFDLGGNTPQERLRLQGRSPVWSPDGKHLALQNTSARVDPELWVIDASNGESAGHTSLDLSTLRGEAVREARKMPSRPSLDQARIAVHHASWSPNGRSLSVVAGLSAWNLDPDGQRRDRVHFTSASVFDSRSTGPSIVLSVIRKGYPQVGDGNSALRWLSDSQLLLLHPVFTESGWFPEAANSDSATGIDILTGSISENSQQALDAELRYIPAERRSPDERWGVVPRTVGIDVGSGLTQIQLNETRVKDLSGKREDWILLGAACQGVHWQP
jgi:Tol biopolymer transport system component